MPTQHPRLQVTLDAQSNQLLSTLAGQEKQSRSALAAELIREALELREDAALSHHADSRLRETTQWRSHTEAWGA